MFVQIALVDMPKRTRATPGVDAPSMDGQQQKKTRHSSDQKKEKGGSCSGQRKKAEKKKEDAEKVSTDQSPTKLVQPGTSRLLGDSVKIKMGLLSIDTDDIRPVLYQVKRVLFHPVILEAKNKGILNCCSL